MSDRYSGYRYPKAIIGYTVFLYHRFKLSLRDIQELLLERGIDVTYETIRAWNQHFGSLLDKGIQRRKRFKKVEAIHRNEMRVKIKGEIYWLCRAIDRDGNELDILLQKRRNAKAALRFFKRLLTHHGQIPRVLVTDKLKSYGKAKRALLPKTEHRYHKRLNNLCENSYQPTREKERQMRRFKKPGLTQKFLDSMGKFLNLFKVGRYKNTAQNYKLKLMNAFYVWEELIYSTIIAFKIGRHPPILESSSTT